MKREYIPTVIAISAGVILAVTGLLMGQYANVLAKATRICLECIGLGK